jgi:hypothetical protein
MLDDVQGVGGQTLAIAAIFQNEKTKKLGYHNCGVEKCGVFGVAGERTTSTR